MVTVKPECIKFLTGFYQIIIAFASLVIPDHTFLFLVILDLPTTSVATARTLR